MKNDGEFNVAYTIFKQMALSNVDKDLELKKRELSVDYWKLDLEDFRTVFIQLNSPRGGHRRPPVKCLCLDVWDPIPQYDLQDSL